MKQESSFYCYKTNQRKSAWNTPEYLSKEDWDFLRKVARVLKNWKPEKLYNLLWSNPLLVRPFFNHTLGWPEGWVYCQDSDYCKLTAFPGLKRHNLPKMEEALLKRKEA